MMSRRETLPHRCTKRAGLVTLAAAFLAPTLAMADPIEAFSDICGKAELGYEERVAALKSAGWSFRAPGMWSGYRDQLEEGLLATTIAANQAPANWAKVAEAARQLADISAMTPAQREQMGMPKIDVSVLVSIDPAEAVLVIFDESPFAEGTKIHCVYSGPMPQEAAVLVDQFKKSGWTEKSDAFVEQYTIDHTSNRDGKLVRTAMLISVLTEKSEERLGRPPNSAAQLSIFTLE